MPTGYTVMIEKGCTFEEFVWGCARAFGALIDLREAPRDAPIPEEIKPCDYHKKALEEAEYMLKQLNKMTLSEIKIKIEAERAKVERENRKRREEHHIKMARYAAIREEVERWNPPTPDHRELKRFMLEQIDISTENPEAYQAQLPSRNEPEWKEERQRRLLRDIEYHRKHYAEDVERAKGRTEWINALRASVPTPTKKEK